ncbi:MAG: iron ABC transporter permease [Bifidobacteriaceae bacterium]|jgi:thiamine transport system permease protein|nr:iron ABC transporter permease [Bifidobacteriaceae bacterium]
MSRAAPACGQTGRKTSPGASRAQFDDNAPDAAGATTAETEISGAETWQPWVRRAGLISLAAVPAAFLAIFFVWPVATLVARGFTAAGAWDWSGFGEVLGKARTWRLIGRTVGQATAATAICAAAAVPVASLLYRRDFPGRGFLRALLTMPFALPSVAVSLAFRALLGAGGPLGFLSWEDGFAPVLAALVFFNVGLMTRVVGAFWSALDPRPEQAARVLGAGPWRALLTVTLPALTPALAAGGSLVFLFCATAFAPVLILGGSTYTTVETEIYLQTAQMLDLRSAAVLSVVQMAVVAVALCFGAAARRRRESALKLTGGGGAGAGSWGDGIGRIDLRRRRRRDAGLEPAPTWAADWPSVALTALAAALIALPLVNLVYRSLRTNQGLGLGNFLALADSSRAGLPHSLAQAAGRSVVIALLAGAMALGLGLAVAVVLSRRPAAAWARRAQEMFDSVLMAPLGVSAVTVGFGFLITLNRAPLNLRTSFWLIPLAQALVALPLVVRTALPALRAVDPRLRQAAAVLGAAPWRVFLSLDAALARRAVAVAAAFAFAVSVGEFGATSFLARPDTTTLPVAIYKLLGRPGADNLGLALAGAVLLAAMTSLVMGLAEARWSGLVRASNRRARSQSHQGRGRRPNPLTLAATGARGGPGANRDLDLGPFQGAGEGALTGEPTARGTAPVANLGEGTQP